VPGLADLIATAGLATDDPHESSGPARKGSGPVAAHEWEPLPDSPSLGPWPMVAARRAAGAEQSDDAEER